MNNQPPHATSRSIIDAYSIGDGMWTATCDVTYYAPAVKKIIENRIRMIGTSRNHVINKVDKHVNTFLHKKRWVE